MFAIINLADKDHHYGVIQPQPEDRPGTDQASELLPLPSPTRGVVFSHLRTGFAFAPIRSMLIAAAAAASANGREVIPANPTSCYLAIELIV